MNNMETMEKERRKKEREKAKQKYFYEISKIKELSARYSK